MLDDYKNSQPIAYRLLTNAFLNHKNVHAYLIETKKNYNQLDFALAFTKFIMCPEHHTNRLECGKCTQCSSIDDGNFTEIKIIEPVNNVIKKEQLLALQKEFSTKSNVGGKRVYIINHAECMNTFAANSILKFLEEPAEGIIAILLCDNQYQMLDTIVSRCQLVSLNNSYKFCDSIECENKTELKIASILFDSNEQIKNYVEDEKSIVNIEAVIHFAEYYERHHLGTLLRSQELWHNYFTDTISVNQALDIMILFYKDVLNVMLKQKIEVMDNYESVVNDVAIMNNIDDIVRKIGILINTKEKMKYNINKGLLIDKLILNFEGEK